MDAFWIILTAAMIAASCGILGSFLILRKMAMLGDAISHAVLPGMVTGFLLSGSREPFPMLAGAALFGLLTASLVEYLHRRVGMRSDASIGFTFTTLFAIGIILLTLFAGQVDLDQECVLYGEIGFITLDTIRLPFSEVFLPRAVIYAGLNLLLVLLILIIGYRGFFVTTFNPEFAASAGISVYFWHYLLMGLVSLTTVLSFESVGAILVVGFLVVPPAAAFLLTRSLPDLLVVSVVLGTAAAAGGYYLAVFLNGSIAGAMAVFAGFLFVVALLFSRVKGSWNVRFSRR